MNRRSIAIAAGLCAAGLGIAVVVVPAIAQQAPDQADPTVESPAVQEVPAGQGNRLDQGRARAAAVIIATRVAPRSRWRETVFCSLNRASEVQRFAVDCQNATRLNTQVADCCIAGDHWEVKAKVWDQRPNTAVATSPGGTNVFGVNARVFNYGGTPENPRHLYAEIDCSMLHGVDIFPADSTLVLTSDGTCTVTDLGKRDEIHRTP